jgi:hypothetical protein
MWIAGIWSDQQIPYHDPRALAVATQIFADAKLDLLVYNGDWGDYMALGKHPSGDRDDIYESFRNEIRIQRERLAAAHKAIRPKRSKWVDGNHEFRVQRAFWNDPKMARTVLQIDFTKAEVTSVKQACSIPVIMELAKYGIEYAGQYPNGIWLKDGLEPERNVYVHHGYTARKKGGYTVSGQMDDHWSSQIVGHCERLAGPIWTRKLGRDYFGVEGGNLSLIGEPELGDGIYAGVPHSVPKLMNHRQGITIVYRDANEWWPFTIKIREGRAVWNGRLYKA